MKEIILQFLADNWESLSTILLAILYEVTARWIPTEKNRSIIDNVVKLIGFIIKNRRKPSPQDDADITEKVNRVIVDRDKHIISIFLLFALSLPAFAQQGWSNFKGIRLVNQLDSTQVLPVNGAIYYNEQSDKFRAYQNNAWVDLIGGSGGGGTSYTFENGLTENSGVVTWGGVVNSENVNIEIDNPYSFTIYGENSGNTFYTSQNETSWKAGTILSNSDTAGMAFQNLNFNYDGFQFGAGSFAKFALTPDRFRQAISNGANDSVYFQLYTDDGFDGFTIYQGIKVGSTFVQNRISGDSYSFTAADNTGVSEMVCSPLFTNLYTYSIGTGEITTQNISSTGQSVVWSSGSNVATQTISDTHVYTRKSDGTNSSEIELTNTDFNILFNDGVDDVQIIGNTGGIGMTYKGGSQFNLSNDITIYPTGNIIIPIPVRDDTLLNVLAVDYTTGAIKRRQISSGGGITNTAAVNELPITTDGSGNLGSSGIESTTAGNVNLGLSSTTGTTRTLTAAGSGTNIALTTITKGDGTFTARQGNNNASLTLAQTGSVLSNTTAGLELFTGNGLIQLTNLTSNAIQSNSTYELRTQGRSSGTSPTVTLRSGNGTSTASSGRVNINTGSVSGTGDVGDIFIETGSNSGSGLDGNINIEANGTGVIGLNSEASVTMATSSGSRSAQFFVDAPNSLSILSVVNGSSVSTIQTTDALIEMLSPSIQIGDNLSGTVTVESAVLTLDAIGGELYINISRTSCAGAPSGSVARVSGVLTVCP